MVAAPETQAQAYAPANDPPQGAEGAAASKDGQQASPAEAGGAGAAGAQPAQQGTEAQQGVNGLTAVDASTPAPSSFPVDAAGSAAANLPPPDVARNIPCRFFPLGTCKYGEQCIFSHGIPGVAGSPGIPASPSVQAAVAPGQGQAQQQGGISQQQMEQHQMPPMMEGYMPGMPMYYEQGMEYGFQAPPFSPQQGFYPFPPPFQAYPQHFQQPYPPQPFYQPVPAAPQQMMPAEAAPAAPSPAASPEQQVSSQQATPAPTASVPSPDASAAASSPSYPTASAPQPYPVVPEMQQGYAPYPGYAPGAEYGAFVPPPMQTSPPTAFGADGVPLPRAPSSLHTFFQTSATVPPVASSAASPPQPATVVPGPASMAAVPGASPNSFVKPLPRVPGPRRSIGGLPAGPFPGGKPRRSFGGARPPCSFFEANRCKNGDECLFAHMLPDGSDARALGRGMIGADGRTDHPEATGGMPPAWLASQRSMKYGGAGPAGAAAVAGGVKKQMQLENGAILNGGYSFRERTGLPPAMVARNRFEEEQQARFARAQQEAAMVQQQQQAQGQAAQVENGTAPVQPQQQGYMGVQRPFVNGPLAGRIPPGGAPQLVAAINGLTRRIPPAHLPPTANGSSPAQVPAPNSTQRDSSQQRVPSVDDFPALSSPAAPLSPATEKEAFDAPTAAAAADAKKQTGSPTVSETDGFVMVSHADATPASTSTSSPAATTAAPVLAAAAAPAPAAESTTPAAAPTPVPAPAASPVPTPAPAPPKAVLSFASAAARGASVVLPEKPKPVRNFTPVSKEAEKKPEAAKEEKSEKVQGDGFVRKEGKKKGGAGGKGAAKVPSAPVAVKA
ncbi:hypothetical protein JCM1841_004527 [Sporobolomyces salmonicolor]